MQERRRQTPVESHKPDDAPPGLKEAMLEFGWMSWEWSGDSVVVHTGTRSLTIDKDYLYRLAIHRGNPEAIAEIVEELKRPGAKLLKRPRSTKSGNRGKTSSGPVPDFVPRNRETCESGDT